MHDLLFKHCVSKAHILSFTFIVMKEKLKFYKAPSKTFSKGWKCVNLLELFTFFFFFYISAIVVKALTVGMHLYST